MGTRGAEPKGKVRRIWDPAMAYAIGLIATDGSLSSDGRHINLTSSDRCQLVTFKKCLGVMNVIGSKRSGFTGRKNCLQVQFGDILFYKWLVQIGLHSHKSKTLGALKIPDKYFFDFLRGCLDGDGTVWTHRDPRWRSSHMLVTAFCSASRPFLKWVQGTALRLADLDGDLQPDRVGVYQLRYHKRETHILMRHMYYKAGLPHLSRKRQRYLAICKLDD